CPCPSNMWRWRECSAWRWSSPWALAPAPPTMTISRGSTLASTNSTRGCRARPRAPNRPISPRSRPTSGWISWKAASSSSNPRRAASRAVSRPRTIRDERLEPGPVALAGHRSPIFTGFNGEPPIHTCTHLSIRAASVALAMALAFASSGAAHAEDPAAPPASAVDQLPPDQELSGTVIDLAGWVVAANDSQGYPFAVIDKAAAQILVFGGDGRLRGAAPGLFGSAVGDHSAPGIAGLALREIPGRDRTTPAGRFVGG